MAKLTNFKELLKKISKNSYKKHTFIKEWQVFVLITIILKVAAMVFSVFAGYFYFNQLFISILNNNLLASIFSVVILIIVEILTAISLSKFFKFALRLELKTALPILLLSLFFFSISFISSTNGLALRQSKKVDNTEILAKQYNDKALNINLLYDNQKDLIKEQISTIKANPQGWTKGKRTILLDFQLKQIDKYYIDLQINENNRKDEVNKLTLDYKNNISLNNLNRNLESEKYFKIVAFLMILIFLINGLLMFFYSKIFNEQEQELAVIEVIQTFGDDINSKATNLIENQISDTFNMYFAAIQNNFETQIEQAETKSIIGFTSSNQKDKMNVVNTNVVNTAKGKTQNRTCKHCGNEFIYRTWNQVYCSSECRIKAWEHKTNRKLKFKAKK